MEITALTKLGGLADRQYGQITRQQAAEIGIQIGELVDSGFAEWILADVFRLRAGGRSRFPQLYAAWLQLVPATPAAGRSPPSDGVVSHDAALQIYGVPGEPGPTAEFTVPGTFTGSVDIGQDIKVHIGEIAPDEWVPMAGMPVTTPSRTLIDLTTRYDIDELARMAASFVAEQRISEPDLRATLARGLARRPLPFDAERWTDAVLAEVGRS